MRAGRNKYLRLVGSGPIGGLKEKALAAHRAEINDIVIPIDPWLTASNRAQARHLPRSRRRIKRVRRNLSGLGDGFGALVLEGNSQSPQGTPGSDVAAHGPSARQTQQVSAPQ